MVSYPFQMLSPFLFLVLILVIEKMMVSFELSELWDYCKN